MVNSRLTGLKYTSPATGQQSLNLEGDELQLKATLSPKRGATAPPIIQLQNHKLNHSVLDHALMLTLHSLSLSTETAGTVSYIWPFPPNRFCFRCPTAGAIFQESKKRTPRFHPLGNHDLSGLRVNKKIRVAVAGQDGTQAYRVQRR